MGHATEGVPLVALVRMAIPLCQQAQAVTARARRGAKPEFRDWQIAALIMVAVLKRKKSKSAQYRFLFQHRRVLAAELGLKRFPVRSTYCRRYTRIHPLFQAALKRHTAATQREGWLDPTHASVDKSVVPARGRGWSAEKKRQGKRPAGVDVEASWTYSDHHGWQYGFGYDVVVCRTKSGAVWPMLASVETACVRESSMFLSKIADLPRQTRSIAGDKAYDRNAVGEAIEWNAQNRRTGRRFLCPQIYRGAGPRKIPCTWKEHGARAVRRQRREARLRFFKSAVGQRWYARRKKTVEPFHQWFKERFELHERCWHRGLNNNKTQILAALFAYQLLLRYNRQRRIRNAQLAWILDGL
jgi:hypothetical protein